MKPEPGGQAGPNRPLTDAEMRVVLATRYPSLYSVLRETERATRLHGPLPTSDGRRLAVLGREVGEAFDAEGDVDRSRRKGDKPIQGLSHLYDELSQVASTCVLWMDAIEKEIHGL